jgi:hypothetical protein
MVAKPSFWRIVRLLNFSLVNEHCQQLFISEREDLNAREKFVLVIDILN